MNNQDINPEEKTYPACPLGPPPWHYRCNMCDAEFDMPAPKGPSEERMRRCPNCNSREIEVINIKETEACPPGG